MKTQLFTLIIIAFLSTNAFAAEKSNTNVTPDKVSVSNLTWINSAVEEENLNIQNWMINDNLWKQTTKNVEVENTPVEEEPLSIEPWMTNSKLWEARRASKSNISTIKIGNETYQVYRITNEKEAPLRIEPWMTNDRLWRL